MSITPHRCATCSGSLDPDDRFCGSCGAPAVTAPARPRSLPDARPRAAEPAVAARASGSEQLAQPEAVLLVRRPFCRACGADHDASDAACPRCATGTAPLPPVLTGPLGSAYGFRRGLRKRTGVTVAAAGDSVKVLFESGEIADVAVAQLPKPASPPVPDDALPAARTPQGALLRLAEACSRDLIKGKWSPEGLTAAAVAAVDDVTTARVVALDAIALGRIDLVGSLPLTESERLWLTAVHAVGTADTAAAVASIAQLPVKGYRAKLGLLVVAIAQAGADDLDLKGIEPHLAAYADEEPVAALMHRALGFASHDPADLPAALASNRELLGGGLVPGRLADELAAGLDAVAGEQPAISARGVSHLPPSVRLMLARALQRPGILRMEDVDAAPPALLDDLIDSGALAPEIALAGASDASVRTYLHARFAPELLTDEQVREIEYTDERVRRAFCYGELEALADVEDSPTLRHYRALLAARRKRGGDVDLDDVDPAARPKVRDLLQFIQAKADGVPFSERLTELLLEDPTVWPILVEIAGSTNLDPTPRLRSHFPVFTEWLALHQAREHLFIGEWHAAITAADRCLGLATGEPVRDEAQNLKACGLYYLGRDGEAIRTLEEAIEGAYSESLLANIGIVAAGLAPEVAARHLGVLMVEAPTIPMRVAAAQRALSIWSTSSDTESWRNSDDSPLPDAFQDALHDLVVSDIELSDFREFVSLLAVRDSDWLGETQNLAPSPHRNSLEARFYIARAGDLNAMVAVMGEAIAAGSPPQWVLYERDSLRSAAWDILLENLDEPDNIFGTVALAMADHNVLADAEDDVVFHSLGVASVTYHLSERKTEVVDAIVGRVHAIRKSWQALDTEARTRLDPFVELATRRVAINRMLARDRELDEAVDVFNSALEMGKYAEYGSPAYREAMRRLEVVLDVARSARADLIIWPRLLEHEAVVKDINISLEQSRELERRCLDLLN